MNAGFSAPTNYWGSITGLTPKSSQDGATSSLAEASNSNGDTAYFDVYGEVIAPQTEYAVTGEVDMSDIVLGSVHTVGTKKVRLTTVAITTSAGAVPTVTISGEEVEATATAGITYALTGTLTPRCKAQDVFGALADNDAYTQINSTASIDSHPATVAGLPVASCYCHGKIEVNVTLTDGAGTESIEAASGGDFTITTAESTSAPDAGYITRTATLTAFLEGTTASTSSNTETTQGEG